MSGPCLFLPVLAVCAACMYMAGYIDTGSEGVTMSMQHIAVVQGEKGSDIQGLFRDFVMRWRGSCRIVGVTEETRPDIVRVCGPGSLRSITDDRTYSLFQELGPESQSCALDPGGVVAASEAIEREIAQGCELVLLSKFGKLEAESRSGLVPAYIAAIEARVPVLTSVSWKHVDAWEKFASPLFSRIEASADAIDRWWIAMRQEFAAEPR